MQNTNNKTLSLLDLKTLNDPSLSKNIAPLNINPLEFLQDFKEINYDNFPESKLEVINAHPEIFEPIFFEILDNVSQLSNADDLKEYDLYLLAMYTLGKYKSSPAYEKLIENLEAHYQNDKFDFFKGPDLLGDILTEDLPIIFSACYSGYTKTLKTFINNSKIDAFARLSPITALEFVFAADGITKDEYINIITDLINSLAQTINSHNNLSHINAQEDQLLYNMLLRDLASASIIHYEKLIQETQILPSDETIREIEYLIQCAKKSPHSHLEKKKENSLSQYKQLENEGMKYTLHWHKNKKHNVLFDQYKDLFLPRITTQIIRETPKIGRNDPCPCGSAIKYKKCCGK